MRRILPCWFFFLIFLIFPFSLWGRIDYTKLDPDSPEVRQACEEALKNIRPGQGIVAVEKKVVAVDKIVVDVIGIPKGTAGSGLAIAGQVAKLETALKDLGAEVSKTEIRIELPSDVLFDFDKSNIRPDAREALSKVAVVIASHTGKTVWVEGHTDSRGDEEYNMKLSFRRAESVKQWLVDREKLTHTKFQIDGWGESKPIASNDTDEGRQKNRRVEIIIKK